MEVILTRSAVVRGARARAAIPVAAWLLLGGCAGGDDDANVVRGRGLQPAALAVAAEAQIHDAVARSAFDPSPDLHLLMSSRRLPRTAGVIGGPPTSPALLRALRGGGMIEGSCAAPADSAAGAVPLCKAGAPGYLLRTTQPLQLAGDTVQIYLRADRYTIPGAPAPEAFHFEKAYQLVPRDGRWRVVREGRVPDSDR